MTRRLRAMGRLVGGLTHCINCATALFVPYIAYIGTKRLPLSCEGPFRALNKYLNNVPSVEREYATLRGVDSVSPRKRLWQEPKSQGSRRVAQDRGAWGPGSPGGCKGVSLS